MQFMEAVPTLRQPSTHEPPTSSEPPPMLYEQATRLVVRTLQLPKGAAGLSVRTLCCVGGHVGSMIQNAVPRDSDDLDASAAHQEHVRDTAKALEGTAWLGGREALAQLHAAGAQLVARTTPPIARTANHDDGLIPAAYERQNGFPTLTILGNLNKVPEIAAMVRRLAVSLTYRRRLVIFQQATGIVPPAEVERFHLPSR